MQTFVDESSCGVVVVFRVPQALGRNAYALVLILAHNNLDDDLVTWDVALCLHRRLDFFGKLDRPGFAHIVVVVLDVVALKIVLDNLLSDFGDDTWVERLMGLGGHAVGVLPDVLLAVGWIRHGVK